MENTFVVMHRDVELLVDLSNKYSNGGMRAIKLFMRETGEPWCSATQNYPNEYAEILKSDPRVVTIKNVDENEGIVNALINADVIEEHTAYLGGTGGSVLVCMLSKRSLAIIDSLPKPIVHLTWRELIEILKTIPDDQLDDLACVNNDGEYIQVTHVNINNDNDVESLEVEMNGPTSIHTGE